MPDDREKTGPADASRINVNEPYELKYWTHKFQITPEVLKQTVKITGPMVKDVKSHLDAAS